VLREVAAALASPNEAALLASEPRLSLVVDELRALHATDPDAREMLVAELQRAQVELDRCRRLGSSAIDLVGRILALHSGFQYDHQGLATSTPTPAIGRIHTRL
jgi:hypothetical protein